MRLIVDLPEATLARLSEISKERKLTLETIIGEALEQFAKSEQNQEAAFGSWKNTKDGLAMQHELRNEW